MSYRHLVVCALALVPVFAGCAVSAEEPTPDESTATAEGAAKTDGCMTVRCAAGTHCVSKGGRAACVADVVKLCPTSACGPALGMMNYLCPDAVTVAGPSGRCLRTAGTCGWEVISCP